MIRVFHVNLRTLWIYRRIRKLARLAASNVSELSFSSTVPFFFLSLNVLQYNRIHNLNLILRENRGNVRFIQDRFTISCMRFPWSTTKAVRILWTIKFQIARNSSNSFFLLPENDSTAERSSVAKLHRASSALFVQLTGRRFHDVASIRCKHSLPPIHPPSGEGPTVVLQLPLSKLLRPERCHGYVAPVTNAW